MPDGIPALQATASRSCGDVSRDEAVAVLEEYAGSGGMIYNARQGE